MMLLTMATLVLAAPVPVSPEQVPIALPKDPKTVVIEFAYKGGFTPPRKNMAPNLTVTVDGTVTANDPFTDVTAKISLSPEELQRLLQEIIREKKYFEIDPAKVTQEIQGANPGPLGIAIADAATSQFLVRTAEKEHALSYYALSFQAEQYKKVESLQRLLAIEKKLNQLLSMTWAGGPKAVEESLNVGNAEIKKTFPDLKPLVQNDLRFARVAGQQGKVTLNFHRMGTTGKDFLELGMAREGAEAPKITSLARGLTVAEYNAHAKDEKAFSRILDGVNAEVKKKFPTFGLLAAEDLQSLQWRDGQIQAFFRRSGAMPTNFVTATIMVPSMGAPVVRVNGRVQ